MFIIYSVCVYVCLCVCECVCVCVFACVCMREGERVHEHAHVHPFREILLRAVQCLEAAQALDLYSVIRFGGYGGWGGGGGGGESLVLRVILRKLY